jgi:hypothetical protein
MPIKFVKPAGQQLSGPTTVISKTIQNMPGNSIMVIGVSGEGVDKVKRVGPNDPSAAMVNEMGKDPGSGVRWFQFTGKRACNVLIDAIGADDSVVDTFQLFIKTPAQVNLPKASSPMEFEFEPDDPSKPGQMNMRVYTPRNEPDYVENQVEAVGFGIYLFGFHLYTKNLELAVLVPDSHIDFTVSKAEPIDTNIYADRAAADAAILAAPAAAQGVTRYAFYRGAGGALIVPTIFSPATTPVTIQTLLTARALLADEVQKELIVLVLTMVGGMVLKSIAARLVRIGSKSAEPLAGKPAPLRIKPAATRLQSTARDLQGNNPIRTSEVLAEPKTFRHTITGDVPPVSYARIEQEGSMRLSTGAKAHYGEGVYAWHPNQTGVGTYIDVQVPPGTGVETIKVGNQSWVRMVPPEGNALQVKIVGTNMPESQINLGRQLLKPGK